MTVLDWTAKFFRIPGTSEQSASASTAAREDSPASNAVRSVAAACVFAAAAIFAVQVPHARADDSTLLVSDANEAASLSGHWVYHVPPEYEEELFALLESNAPPPPKLVRLMRDLHS